MASWPSPTSCKGSCLYDHAIKSYFDDEALKWCKICFWAQGWIMGLMNPLCGHNVGWSSNKTFDFLCHNLVPLELSKPTLGLHVDLYECLPQIFGLQNINV